MHSPFPFDQNDVTVDVDGKHVRLTNLHKVYWPERGITKGQLLTYYALLAPALLPHLANRAMSMKRYPNGIHGKFFFMKRKPTHAPDWLSTCRVDFSTEAADCPIIQDLASLLWVVNLGCIDLNPSSGRCDAIDLADYLQFDLDPVAGKPGVPFQRILQVAIIVRDALAELGMTSYVKTSGSRGMHVFAPVRRGPTQKQAWMVAKSLAFELARRHPKLITVEYSVPRRPPGRVLMDYNQNAPGRTLASVYSVRPTKQATVSTPLTWEEVEKGIDMDDFRLDTMPQRLAKLGDLWKPLTYVSRGRFALDRLLTDS